MQSANKISLHSNLSKQEIYYLPVKEGAGIATSSAVTIFCLP